GWRHKVHEPWKVSIRNLRLAGQEELTRLGRKRRCGGRARGARGIAAHETRKLRTEQHEKPDTSRPLRAWAGHDEGAELRKKPIRGRGGMDQVVAARRNTPQTKPRVTGKEALEVVGCGDIQVVAADDGADEFCVVLHHDGGEIELTFGDQ